MFCKLNSYKSILRHVFLKI